MRTFIYGPGIDEPIIMIVPGEGQDPDAWYFYFYGALGNVVALADEDGDIVEAYSYDVFGACTVHTGPGVDGDWLTADDTVASPDPAASVYANPYRFTGRRLDPETALYYYRARYYDCVTGRFLQTDPVGYDDGMNLYAYVSNNPINWIDPFGLALSKQEALQHYISDATEAIQSNIRALEISHEQQRFWQNYYNSLLAADTAVTVFSVSRGISKLAQSSAIQRKAADILRNPSGVPQAYTAADLLTTRGEALKHAARKGLAWDAAQAFGGLYAMRDINSARRRVMAKYDPLIEQSLANIDALAEGVEAARRELQELQNECK